MSRLKSKMYHLRLQADRASFASLIEVLQTTDNVQFLELLRTNGVASAEHLENINKGILRGIMGDLAMDRLWARHRDLPPSKRRRRDLPDVHQNRRGSVARIEEALDSNGLGPASSDIDRVFQDDKFAKTTQGPRESRWKTWQKLAKLRNLPALPITVELVDRVGAAFKAGKYRSASLYFSRARQEHVDQFKQHLPADVEAAITRAIRSINRGKGPDKPKDSFRLEQLDNSDKADDFESFAIRHLRDHGIPEDELPLSCLTIVVESTWFLLRGIELAAALREDWTFDDQHQCLRWNLPVSKTDTEAKGAIRSHHCSCAGATSTICPYHTAKRYIQSHGANEHGFLFPTRAGEPLSKTTVARLAEAAAMFLQTADMSDWPTDSVQSWAEHAYRVSGAQMFARAGLDLYLIQLLGRWGSRAIERYVQDAPLANTAWAASAVAGLSNSNGLGQARLAQDADTTTHNQAVAQQTAPVHTEPQRPIPIHLLRESVTQIFAEQQWFIHNPKSKTVHKPDRGEFGSCSTSWRTKCNRWRYGMASYIRHISVLPDYKQCERCFESVVLVCEPCTSEDDSESSSS